MPASPLADLLATDRTDVIAGYALSPFTLKDFADVEQEFCRLHIAAAAGAAVGLPPALQKIVVEVAAGHVADGRFNYGTIAFDQRAMAQSSTPFLLWVGLRAKRPGITRPEVVPMIRRENDQAVYYGVREMMGYDFSDVRKVAGEDRRPAQWAWIIGALRKKGLDYDQIGSMTTSQVTAELGLVKEKHDPQQAIRAARKQAQEAAFDTLCFVYGLTVEQLVTLDGSALLACASELFPKGMDPTVLLAAAQEYSAARLAEAATPLDPQQG